MAYIHHFISRTCSLILLFILAISMMIQVIHAETTWQAVGPEGFTTGSDTDSEVIKFDTNNTPYLFTRDCTDGCILRTYTWDGDSWNELGDTTGFSSNVYEATMILGADGYPIVAYSDGDQGGKLSVIRWTGTTWEYIDGPEISGAGASYLALALDETGKPYVAFKDELADYKQSVIHWDGTDWGFVGTPGISSGAVNYGSIVVDNSTGDVYVGYQDNDDSNKLTVKVWNGTSWSLVGGVAATSGAVGDLNLGISPDHVVYAIYQDSDASDHASVVRLFDGSWVQVGSQGFTETSVYNVRITFSSNGVPYITYLNNNDYNVSVMKFTDTWEYVGEPNFSDIYLSDPSIALDANDIPYVAYQDYPKSNRATVRAFMDVSMYEGDETGAPYSPETPGALTTFNNVLKTLAKDTNYWITNISGTDGGYDTQLYKFTKDIVGLTTPQYVLNWTGHGDTPEDKNVVLSLWNFLMGGWDQVASQHCDSDCDLSATTTNSVYRDMDGSMWVQAKADNAMPGIEIVNGSISFNTFFITATWKTNVPGDSEVVYDSVPHDTWDEFLEANNGGYHNYDGNFTTDHSIGIGIVGYPVYYMVRSTTEDNEVVTSDLQGPLAASCPFVFTYGANSEYNFITDVSTSATFNIGFQRARWAANPFYRDPNSNNGYVNPLSFAQLPHDALVPRTQGDETYYDIKATTEQNEVDYFDDAKLQVIDHDPNVNVYPDYRENGEIHTVSKDAPAPVSVTDEHSNDVLSQVAHNDNVYWQSATSSTPLATPSYIDIKLSNEETTPANLKLIIKRGKEGPFPTSASDVSRESFQYKNAEGNFVDLPTDKNIFVVTRDGAPHASRNWVNAEGTQTKVIDLSGLQIKDNTVRLVSMSNIRQWDVDWLAVDTTADQEVTTTTLAPYSADLHYRGISTMTPTNPSDSRMKLLEPIYDQLTNLFVATPITGNATKYGDVAPLLSDADNKFVIMVQGDELSMKYHVPEQSEGTVRDFIYETWDYQKAYSGPLGDTILPLPFNEMTQYPYHEDVESYPYGQLQSYIDEYNTRVIDRDGIRSELDPMTPHHSLNTDFLSLTVSEAGEATSTTPHKISRTGGGGSVKTRVSYLEQNGDHQAGDVLKAKYPSVFGTNERASDTNTFTRDLTKGSKGSDVKQLQIFLNAHGYMVAANGPGSKGFETDTFGPATQAALAKFQAAQGISPAAGYLGSLSRAAIAAMEASTRTDANTSASVNPEQGTGTTGATSTPATNGRDLTLNMTGDDVKQLQQFLIAKGYTIVAGATGWFGAQTRDALAKYQTASGIAPAVGYYGAMTRAYVATHQ
jgi:Putative peptidoglycan binding domain